MFHAVVVLSVEKIVLIKRSFLFYHIAGCILARSITRIIGEKDVY